MLLSHCYRLCRLFTAVRVFLWVWEAGATLWLPSSGVASPAAERRLFCPRLQGLPLPGSWAQAQQLWQVGRAALQHAGPSRSRDRTRLSAWAGRFFTTEPPGKPLTPLSKALRLSQGCRGCLTLPLLRVSLKRPDRPAHAQARTGTHSGLARSGVTSRLLQTESAAQPSGRPQRFVHAPKAVLTTLVISESVICLPHRF